MFTSELSVVLLSYVGTAECFLSSLRSNGALGSSINAGDLSRELFGHFDYICKHSGLWSSHSALEIMRTSRAE